MRRRLLIKRRSRRRRMKERMAAVARQRLHAGALRTNKSCKEPRFLATNYLNKGFVFKGNENYATQVINKEKVTTQANERANGRRCETKATRGCSSYKQVLCNKRRLERSFSGLTNAASHQQLTEGRAGARRQRWN